MTDPSSAEHASQPMDQEESTSQLEGTVSRDAPEWRSGVGRGKYKPPKPLYKVGETVYTQGARSLIAWTVAKVHSDCTYDLKDASGKMKSNVREDDID